MDVKLEESWKQILRQEFGKNYFQSLVGHLKMEKRSGKTIYPPGSQIFQAFHHTPFDQVKVVILGQDPYHGAGQAMGLSFSVPDTQSIPPSLQNIYKELHQDIGVSIPTHGDLTEWAKRGVLLLNATLTVRADEPNSHAQLGWQSFTDAVITQLSNHRPFLVFLLWGKFAQDKQGLIDETKHVVLKAAHPSPFSAHKGFFGCKHFSQANAALMKAGIDPIDWQIHP
jgi:uracil-DNA glycosylase